MPVDELDGTRPTCGTKFRCASQKQDSGLLPNFSVNKPALREVILQTLREELGLQLKAAALAREEAISDESRARSKYDTHSQEAAYLAEGQAKLAAEIESSLELYSSVALPDFTATDAVAIGALVQLESAGRRAWYFLGPRAGGLEVVLDGRDILVLTPPSPLGRELIGKHVGDVVKMPGRSGGMVAHTIMAIE
jgi:transcription elongation GreA/GreB family factor